MEYIYDIILNFQDDYYDFYEWNKKDKLINIKRIPIYKISSKDYLNIKKNNVTIDRKSLPKQNKMFLITSSVEVMGILLDNQGKVLKKSSLLFEESDDILEDKEDIKLINIKYHIDNIKKDDYNSRVKKEKKLYVDKYLNSLDKIKDKYILKYLYYDIYNIDEDNIDIIYKKLQALSSDDISKVYTHIKNINIELKRDFLF